MFNPFKRKYRVAMDDSTRLYDKLTTLYVTSQHSMAIMFYDWIEKEYGIKRKYSWGDNKNYLIFDSEAHYAWFLMKL